MARPKKYRRVTCKPGVYFFKPRGIPLHELKVESLGTDEVEALRLADVESMSHEEAAFEMRISRATFGRIIKSARNKVAKSIFEGKAIEINK